MTRINPAILRWARETAGLDRAEAAKRIDLSATREHTAVERIAQLEEGEAEPSRPLLVRMAKQYRRPLIAFYLATPPAKGERGQDFRTLPADHDEGDEALLDVLLRDIRARQALVRAALEDEDSPEPLPFIGTLTRNASLGTAVEIIRKTLEVSIAQFRSAADADAAFKILRDRVEGIGAYVLLIGNLGSHHTTLNLETFRGLAIADRIAPFIVINDQDSRAAWSFSLIHELTHLMLGETGVSGGLPTPGVESFCNDVAAEFLLPAAELKGLFQEERPPADKLVMWIDELSNRLHVSRTMISYRLFSTAQVSEPEWVALRRHYREQWIASRERKREQGRESGGGPNYYVVRRQRLGNALLGTAARLLDSGALTTSKTARLLGVKATQLQPLLGGDVRNTRSAS